MSFNYGLAYRAPKRRQDRTSPTGIPRVFLSVAISSNIFLTSVMVFATKGASAMSKDINGVKLDEQRPGKVGTLSEVLHPSGSVGMPNSPKGTTHLEDAYEAGILMTALLPSLRLH